jgi:hypothetical protein
LSAGLRISRAWWHVVITARCARRAGTEAEGGQARVRWRRGEGSAGTDGGWQRPPRPARRRSLRGLLPGQLLRRVRV